MQKSQTLSRSPLFVLHSHFSQENCTACLIFSKSVMEMNTFISVHNYYFFFFQLYYTQWFSPFVWRIDFHHSFDECEYTTSWTINWSSGLNCFFFFQFNFFFNISLFCSLPVLLICVCIIFSCNKCRYVFSRINFHTMLYFFPLRFVTLYFLSLYNLSLLD